MVLFFRWWNLLARRLFDACGQKQVCQDFQGGGEDEDELMDGLEGSDGEEDILGPNPDSKDMCVVTHHGQSYFNCAEAFKD